MLKIGILISDFNQLMNWEFRIIETIINDPELELSLLIKEDESRKNIPTQKNIFSRLTNFLKNPGKSLFPMQIKLEKKYFFHQKAVDKENIIKHLQSIPALKLNPERKGKVDLFSATDSKKVKKHNLDVLLKHGFNIIQGDILQASRYGIWSFNTKENEFHRGGLLGFWEIVLKTPTVEVALEQLSSDTEKMKIIDKAYFNKTHAFITTNSVILEASFTLLMKNIKELKKGHYSTKEAIREHNLTSGLPNLLYFFKYESRFYSHLVKRTVENFNRKYFKSRYDCWTLLIGKGNFMNASLKKLKPIKLPKHEFWADPFFFKHKNQDYVFFENYSYIKKLGKISCGRLENDRLVDICDVLDFDFHLSYPNVFEEQGEIFLMPEMSNNKKLNIYRCVEFPKKWELYSTAFEGEIVFDATFYDDDNNQKWLFINKQLKSTPIDSELYIYKVDSLKMNELIPHKKNPVIINSKTARNGGPFFKRDGNIYRPSQYNADGVYGRGLNINKVVELTLENYVEETVKTIMPDFVKGINATHHLHQTEDYFVIDVAYKKL